MHAKPTREELLQQIQDLETELSVIRGRIKSESPEIFSIADIEQASDGICVCHASDAFPHVRFVLWNRRMTELTGYSRGEINRKGWYQSVYPDPEVQARAIARMNGMREGVDLEAEDWEITRSDGNKRTLRISTSVLDPGVPNPRIMAIMHDVTDLKTIQKEYAKERQELKEVIDRQTASLANTQEALERSGLRYQALFETANDALFIENDQDKILEVNQKACDLLGYTREELLNMTVADIQAPECRGEVGSILINEISDNEGQPFEAMNLHKDGTRIPVEITINRLEEAGLHLSIVRDIRERRKAAKAREEAFNIIENSPVVAFIWRNATDWPVEYVSKNVKRIFGYAAEDFTAGRVLYSQVVHPEDLDRVAEEVAKASSDPDCTEFTHEPYRIVARDQSIRWVSDHTVIRRDTSGAVTHYQGIVDDITARIEAELAVQESEEKFSLAFHMSPDPIAITRLTDGIIIDVNDSFVKVSGYLRNELVGRRGWPHLNMWVQPEQRESWTQKLENDGSVRNLECWFRKKNGDTFLGSVCSEMFEINGEACVISTTRDITEERQATNLLAAERERLSVTLRSIGDAVITTDRNGCIALMNPIAEELTGWKEAEAKDKPLMEVFRIVNERTRESCPNPVDKVIYSGQVVALSNHTILIAKDGREYCIADSGAPILNKKGKIVGVVLVFRDVTEQRHIENELLKMEKLQSLGVLAGGIAHDFNNFLTGIIGNLSLAKLEIKPGSSVLRSLNEMEKAAMRAKDLTQQLLTFSKGGEPVKHTANLGELVREAAQFSLRGSNVRCEFHMEPELSPADVDEGQISQTLHNLMINADQAMPDGGTITIRGANETFASGNPYALEPGNYTCLSIQDQGMGIKPDYLKKIFDPYFTTKQKGSGLGLAVAYSIINKHDGQLSVVSKLGHGTTFTIRLPASESTVISPRTVPEKMTDGSGRILVMDDEEFIREVAANMLTKMGYDVDLSKDGQSALDLYAKALTDGRPYDAVILDLTVPGGMGGKETIRELKKLHPEVRAIVSSGYSTDPVMADPNRFGFYGTIKKPYLVQDMSAVLNKVIT